MRFITILMACAAMAQAVSSQNATDVHIDSLVNSSRVLMLENGKVSVSKPFDPEVQQKILQFYYDQFRNSQDPGAPYFLFMSKEADMAMGIGGVVRMRGWYDWAGPVTGSAFMPIMIPIHPDPGSMNRLGTTPAGTCLYFRVLGENSILGQWQAYIEANFNGYNGRDFHLKKAYATIRDFTVGYASSTFSDPAAVSPTVDAGGPSNKMDHTTVLIRYMPRIASHWLAAVSVESPDTYIAADGVSTATRSAYIPDGAAFIQYDWGRQGSEHVRLSAVVRTLPYRDLLTASNHCPAGWGIQLSSVSHPAEPLTLYATANYGAGYAGMGGDLLVGTYDLIGHPDRPGELYAPRSFGWSVGIQYNFRSNLFASLMASQTRFLPHGDIDPDEYKYGLLTVANIFWNPVPRIQIGAEIDLGCRHDFSGEGRWARRAGLMAQLSF